MAYKTVGEVMNRSNVQVIDNTQDQISNTDVPVLLLKRVFKFPLTDNGDSRPYARECQVHEHEMR